jgi:enoyl-[acyl-carrier protein] reductase I
MTQLMQGKRGLIMGVANDHSIAWGIARTLAAHGATLAFSYQGEALGRRVKPLAESVGASLLLPCDVEQVDSLDAVFAAIAEKWGSLDFVVHAIAFSDKNELRGRYADTTRENFVRTMIISCFSFTEVARRAAALMPAGGAMLTLTYNGGQRAMPNYNVMGVAKAALEAAVRYIAAELGPKGIRVHAISPGPLATRAASGIPEFDELMDKAQTKAPARSLVSIDDVGAATAFLALDGAKLITGGVMYIDGGYHIID